MQRELQFRVKNLRKNGDILDKVLHRLYIIMESDLKKKSLNGDILK